MTVKEFNLAVDQYADGLFRFAIKHLKNASSAEDVVQDTFTKVWEKHESISEQKVKSYLFTSAYHCIVDWIKKEKRGFGEFTQKNEGCIEMQNFDVKTIIDMALDQLPEIQKTVILLRDYEGYSYEEIAEICELSDSQVKVYIFRARKTMKEILKESSLII